MRLTKKVGNVKTRIKVKKAIMTFNEKIEKTLMVPHLKIFRFFHEKTEKTPMALLGKFLDFSTKKLKKKKCPPWKSSRLFEEKIEKTLKVPLKNFPILQRKN